MVIDTSALFAAIAGEADSAVYRGAIVSAPVRRVSVSPEESVIADIRPAVRQWDASNKVDGKIRPVAESQKLRPQNIPLPLDEKKTRTE